MNKKKTENNDQAYMKVLKKLRELIATEYRDGGRFPASREMCQQMGVNRLTYSKALNCLLLDGSARNFRQKGVFIVPEKYRCHKVGLVIESAQDSPFLGAPGIYMSQAINELYDAGYQAQIIQASPIENLWRKALHHGVSGLLWFYGQDPSKVIPVAKDIQKSLPLIMVGYYDPQLETKDQFGNLPYVRRDVIKTAQKRAELFIRKKHKKVLYLGGPLTVEADAFLRALKKAGVTAVVNDKLNQFENIPKLLPNIIIKEKITGIFSEGGPDRQEKLLKAMEKFPEQAPKPEIYLNRVFNYNVLLDEYPTVAVIGIEKASAECGKIAAEIMLKHLQSGAKLTSREVPADFQILTY